MRGRSPKATSSLGARLSFVCLALTLSASAVVLGCRPSPRRIAQVLADSTLTVQTFDAEGNPLGQGTAFFIAPDTVLTNMHVMKWAKTLKVSSPSRGLSFDIGSVVGVNFDRDLCVLRTTSKEGRALRFAKKGAVAVGDKVYVSGNPKGLQGTVSKGIVSAVREEGRLIQIDAPISPGSSGGPVVNEQGEVIGIATLSVVQGQNLNFAVGLLGGPDVRTVEWPVFDVGFTALSSLERDFLKGPVRRVHTRDFPWYARRLVRGEWQSFIRSEGDEEFNESGMRTISVRHDWDIDEERLRLQSSESWQYHDSRVMSLRTSDGKTTRLSYHEGRIDENELSRPSATHSLAGGSVRYDAFGLLVELRIPGSSTVYSRRADGRLSEENSTDEEGRITRRVYSYVDDACGNWTEKRCSDESFALREIEYYEGGCNATSRALK